MKRRAWNSTLPAADKPIARRVPVKRRNVKRHSANWLRAYGSPERVAFVALLPCAECGRLAHDSGFRRIANAHTISGGGSQKGLFTSIVPLCETLSGSGCHQRQHGINGGWSVLFNLDTEEKRAAAADRTERAWQQHLAAQTPEKPR